MPVNNFMQKDDISVSGESAGEEYEVDQILDVRVLKDGTKEYKVRWKNYGSNDDTWEPMDNLSGAKDALDKFRKAKKQVKKTPKASRTPKTKVNRKRGSQEAEDGENNLSSNEDESDDDFSVSSASKRKKTMDKKSKKAPARRAVTASGGRPSSRPTPHNGDSLTMAISRRMNLGQHSSWLDSGSESDSNTTTAKKKGATDGGEEGKGGAAERRRDEGNKQPKENGTKMPTLAPAEKDDAGHISDDSTATEKLANSPSPHFDNEAKGNGDELNMPSEHDPTPANLSTVLNGGTISKFGSKESSISEHSKKSSRAKRNSRSKVGMYAKRTGQTPTTSKATEHHLKFDGIYFDKNGVLKLVEKGGAQRVFTFEEAKDKNSSALCDYMCDMVTFTEKGKPQIQVAPQEMETEEGQQQEEEVEVVDQPKDDDGKLNFDE
ncbi:hypothetical protein niasHT_014372 [Heterodera trifolii]|uniref:Chromo domain-containing protein n=1 Tax=Heterodera trifolii TaxID=157864 RepID=A0ABD2LIS3_9BILA